MSRRRLVMSFVGVVAPIGLFAGALVADGMFHHPSCPLPDSLPEAVADEPDEPDEPEDPPRDVFDDIASTCGGPEGAEYCTPAVFDVEFERRLLTLPMTRDALEERWLAELANGNHVAAYGLAWLASERALPELRRQLLSDRYFYGWETSTPDPPDSVYADNQYHHHQAYLLAIEKISWGLAIYKNWTSPSKIAPKPPLRDVVKLSRAERARLRRDAAGCDGWRAAIWLLHKLDGAPLPPTRWNRAKRIACEGPWLPGDPGHRI